MPGTAQERDLADPFDPEQAIPKAAHLLADLRRRFGNLGIAAAAYNAGAGAGQRLAARRRAVADRDARLCALYHHHRPVETWTASAGNVRSRTTRRRRRRRPIRRLMHRDPASPRSPTCGVPRPGKTETENYHSSRRGGCSSPAISRSRSRWPRSSACASATPSVIGKLRPMIIGRVLRSRGTIKFYQVRLPAQTREAARALCGRIRAVGRNFLALPS